MNKRFMGSWLTLLAIVVLGMAGVAHAQTTTGFIPEPIVSTIAGAPYATQGAQYNNPLGTCSTGFTSLLNASVYNIGDNCLPTQATILNLVDSAVDSYGNVYWADAGGTGTTIFGTVGTASVAGTIRILYKGGAVAAGLIYGANSWNSAFTGVYANAAAVQSSGVGKVFSVGGGYASALASNTKGLNCAANVSYPATAYTTMGDGCPATLARLSAMHAITVDKYGNIYIAMGQAGSSSIPEPRVIYAGGAQVANLITSINTTAATGVGSVKVGYIYSLGFYNDDLSASKYGTYGDGGTALNAAMTQPNGIAVDSKGNVYVADGRGYGNVTVGSTVYNKVNIGGNNIREIFGVTNGFNLVGNVTTVAGETACGGDYIDTVGNNGLLTSASVDATNAPASDKVGGNSATNTVSNVASYYPYNGLGASSGVPYGCPSVSSALLTQSFSGSSTPYTTAYYPPFSNYFDGDGGPATSAYMYFPQAIVIDGNDNLYISENGSNRIRVVYSGNGTLPSAVYSAFGTSPVAGNIYTYAGVALGGSTGYGTGSLGTNSVTFPTANKYTGLQANNAYILAGSSNGVGAWDAIGVDQAGNVYSYESADRIVWKIDPVSYTAIRWLGGGNYNNYTAGNFCTGTTGPKILDAYGAGCPAVQSYTNPAGKIVFDSAGNIYMANPGTNAGGTGTNAIQKYSLNNQFAATADSSTTTQYVSFLQTYNPLAAASPSAGVTLSSIAFGLEGNTSDTEFSLNATANVNSCTNTTAVTLGNVCAFDVNFTPTHPGQRSAAITLTGTSAASGSTLTVASAGALVGVGTAADLAIDTGTASTIGTGITPAGVAADLNGNVYVADSSGNKVLKGASSGTTLTTLFTGLTSPAQVAVDNAGNVYVTSGNSVIETNPAGTVIATITGTTLMSTAFSAPKGVAIDPSGNLYVADTGNNRVARVTTGGFAQPLLLMTSGTTALTLSSPTQLAFDLSGDLFILDSGNSRIVEVPTASGGGTSYALVVTLDSGITPVGLALDAAGDLYVADNAGTVLEYSPGATPSTPTLPGNAVLTGVNSPVGLAVDANAQVFVADSGATGLTADLRSLGAVNFTKLTSANATLNNVGNSALTLTSPIDSVTGAGASAYTVASAAGGNGCAATSYAAGATCGVTATFAPTVIGSYPASVSFNSNAANTATLSLTGTITTFAIPPTVTVTPAFGFITVAQPLSVSVSVAGTPTPTGTVTLSSGTYTSSTLTLSSGSATFNIPAGSLPVGTDMLTVTYTPDTNSFAKYTSATGTSSVTVTLLAKPTVTVTPASTSITTLQSLSVTVALTGHLGTPTGTLTLTNGGLYNSAAMTLVNGSATFIIPIGSLSVGINPLTASYTADANSSSLYGSTTGTASVTVTLITPTVTVTPAATTITTLQTLAVTIVVGGTPTPTGTVTLSSGSYTSAAATLSNGSATITIPADTLANGWPAITDTLTASYSGNSTYSQTTGTASVAVFIEPIFITGSAVTVPPGGNFGNTSTITIVPSYGFTGIVNLTASITSTPAHVHDLPTLSFGATSPVTITGTANAYATLTVTSVEVGTGAQQRTTSGNTRLAVAAGAMLGCLVFAGFRRKSREGLRALLLILIMFLAVGGFSACSDSTSSGAGTTPGMYTITVTGTSGTVSVTNTISLEVQ